MGDSAVGLEQHRLVEPQTRPTRRRLGRGQPLVRDAGLRECGGERLELVARSVIDRPALVEHRARSESSCSSSQSGRASQRQAYVERVVVREADDA